MTPLPAIAPAFIALGFAIASLTACSGSDSGGASGSGAGAGAGAGISGVFTSVDEDAITMEFKSGGVVKFKLGDEAASQGTYTVDGEKVIVTIDGMAHTLIRDGDCIEDALHVFGKMCRGGNAGAASNVTTRKPPETSGAWVATNEDGEFRLEFTSAKAFTLHFKPADGSQQQPMNATFIIEGDTIHATLPQSMPMVLKWVNSSYESTSFGLPMKFVKQ